jgi:hypothetical protein
MVKINGGLFFLLNRTFCFDYDSLKFYLLGSSSLSPIFQIFKPCNSNFDTLFQIQKPLDLVQKPSMVPCTHYTFPKIAHCIVMDIYTKSKLRMNNYKVLQLIDFFQLPTKFNLVTF